MKLKLSRRQISLVGVAALVVVAVMVSRDRAANQPEGLDAAARQACADFAAGYPKAESKTERLSLADRVTANSSKSQTDAVRNGGADLGRAAGDGGTEWKTAGDAFAAACKTG